MILEKLHHLEKMVKVTLEEIIEETEVIKEGGDVEKSTKLIVSIAKEFLSSMDSLEDFSFDEDSPIEEKATFDSSCFKFSVGSTVCLVDKDTIYEPDDLEYKSFDFLSTPKTMLETKENIYNGVPAQIIEQLNTPEITYVVKCCNKLLLIKEEGLYMFNPVLSSAHADYQFEIGDEVFLSDSPFFATPRLFEQFNITDATLFPEERLHSYKVKGIVIDRNLDPYSGTDPCYVVEFDGKRYFAPSLSYKASH